MPVSQKIYKDDKQQLHVLVRHAGVGGDATLVIPDLQRPYVWSPRQVVYLVDSLLKGWPFGTLLLWDTGPSAGKRIPYRTFWSVVDRLGNGDGSSLPEAGQGAGFRMVLDGQQRLQSLLVAFGGDTWGFRLPDREWCDALERTPSKGRNTKSLWSWGQLCLDLEAFNAGYSQRRSVLDVDYVGALTWALTSTQGGAGPHEPPAGYERPLRRVVDGTPLVRLSQLWEIASAAAATSYGVYQEQVDALLERRRLPLPLQERVRGGLVDLVAHLSDIKRTDVSYLQLASEEDAGIGAAQYDDAVVNIFARLNTAGRSLTRQEITFAWIKRKWDMQVTKKRADQAYDELRADLRGRGMDLDLDQLVSLTGSLWAVYSGDGTLLQQNDLLVGPKVEPMASGLSRDWPGYAEGIGAAGEALRERRLGFGTQVRSLNAFTVYAGWRLLALRWDLERPNLAPTARSTLEEGLQTLTRSHTDRWFMLAQWSRLFARDSYDVLQVYTKQLHVCWKKVHCLQDPSAVISEMRSRMDSWLAELVPAAIKEGVDSVEVTNRNRVSDYTVFLWVWHRLDAERWRHSQITLRTGKRSVPAWHVDHLVPWAWWRDHPILGASDEIKAECNALGNCAHLESDLNSQKSADALSVFLAKVPFQQVNPATSPGEWATALGVPGAMLNPAAADPEALRAAIEARDSQIRADLRAFVRGELPRVDLGSVP